MRAVALVAIWIAARYLDRWVNANRTNVRLLIGSFGHLALALAALAIVINSLLALQEMHQ